LVLVGTLGAGCATAAPGAPIEQVTTGQQIIGHTLNEGPDMLFRPGNKGEIFVFARDLTNSATRHQLQKLGDALANSCDPPVDIVAVVQPGAAAIWPGFSSKSASELSDHRQSRAKCLTPAEGADQANTDGHAEIQVFLDDDGSIRRKVLGTGDPGTDLALALFAENGDALAREPIPASATDDDLLEMVPKAIATVRGGVPDTGLSRR
jgi:hypothetical protein